MQAHAAGGHAVMNRFMLVVSGIAAIGGFLYGYDTGIISGALLSITAEFKLGHTTQELVASAILVGATLGGLSSGWFSDRFGRRAAIIAIAAIFTTGAVAASLAPSALALAMARIFLGLAVGGSSQAVPTYIAELAPAEHRGNLVTTFNVAIGVGIMLASLVGYFLHGTWSWRWMVGVAALPAAFLLCSMFFLPESPRWLASRDRTDDARGSLRRVRSANADIDGELRDIEEGTRATRSSRTRGWRGLAARWVRPAVVCGLGVAAFTQLSGIEMMIYYAPTVLKGAGFGPSAALLSSMGIAAVYLVMTAIGLSVVDRIGRRRLSLLMIPGATLSLLVLGALFVMGMAGSSQAWLLVGCLLVYMAFNSGGLQVVGWLTGSEVYPLPVRGAGTSAQAGMVWGSDLLVTATALTLVQTIGAGGTMWVYAGMNVLAFVFIWFFVPETSGHSLEEIEAALREDRFRPALGRAPGRELQPASG
jgi:sugar porter (SP) family MFS transporter